MNGFDMDAVIAAAQKTARPRSGEW